MEKIAPDQLALLFGAGPGASSSASSFDGDALSRLVDAMVLASGGISAGASKEIVFLRLYGGSVGADIAAQVLALKLRQNPGSLGKLEKIGGALSLKEFMSRMNLNIGGK